MRSLIVKIGMAALGAAVVLVAGSMKTYPENAKMAALIVLVIGVFLAILDERLLLQERQERSREK